MTTAKWTLHSLASHSLRSSQPQPQKRIWLVQSSVPSLNTQHNSQP
jgi:hypothetical protein